MGVKVKNEEKEKMWKSGRGGRGGRRRFFRPLATPRLERSNQGDIL